MIEKEKTPIINLDLKWDKESFKKAVYICEKKYGVLKRQGIIIALFSLNFAYILFSLYSVFRGVYEAKISTVWAPGCGILFSLAFLYCYVIGFPSFIKNQAERNFNSSKISKLPFKVSFFEDKFVYENEVEKITCYWTEVLFCIETEEFFVIKDAGGFILILEKSDLSDKELEDVSNFLKDVLVNRYSNIKKG